MNEVRLQYLKDTGHYPTKGSPESLNNSWEIFDFDEEYVKWLEDKLIPPRSYSVKEAAKRLMKTLTQA